MKERLGRIFGSARRPSHAVAFVVLLAMAVLLGRDSLSSWRVGIENRRLRERRTELLQSIEADSTLLRALDDPEFLERFARENYLMRREGDDVFVIED